MNKENFRWDIAQAGAMACILEATSQKVGNVNRLYDFADCFLEDFLLSAVAIEKTLGCIQGKAVGEAILEAVTLTRRITTTNTNLGIVLLMVPLAKAWSQLKGCGGCCDLSPDNTVEMHAAFVVELDKVLAALTAADTRLVYQAIRLAAPGGLGHSEKSDVKEEYPQITLLEAMRLAANRDLIANEYVNGFRTVLETGTAILKQELSKGLPMQRAIAQLHLYFLSQYPDTLIIRKNDQNTGIEVMNRARDVWESGGWCTEKGQREIRILDMWLRQFRNRLNPGTTADMVANVIFVLILEHGSSFWQSLRLSEVLTARK